jgi:hypothetical protein
MGVSAGGIAVEALQPTLDRGQTRHLAIDQGRVVGLDADQLTGVAPVNIGEQLQPFFFSSRQRSVITLEEAIPSRDVLAV